MSTKDKIIEAAEEIFANYHYEHATVKMICDRANVNIASVNYHFRCKKELYLDVLEVMHQRINSKEKALYTLEVQEKSQEGWERYVTELTGIMLSNPDSADLKNWHKIIFRELNTPSEAFDEIYLRYCLPVLEHINLNIKHFFPHMNKHELFMWFITILSQICFIHSSRTLITKFYGPDFYDENNLKEFTKHISRTMLVV
jgi:AcrR family transcriptional regulator